MDTSENNYKEKMSTLESLSFQPCRINSDLLHLDVNLFTNGIAYVQWVPQRLANISASK
jgi:hypothetical protein